MNFSPFAAVAISATLIVILCQGDPKRQRASGGRDVTGGTIPRRLLAALVCLPGVFFILLGDAAGFLIWLGGSGVAGWLIVLTFETLSRKRRAH